MSKQINAIPGYQEFPKWKYQGARGVVVNTADEEAALGDGYTDSPTEEAAPAPAADPRDARIAELEALLAAQNGKRGGKRGAHADEDAQA